MTVPPWSSDVCGGSDHVDCRAMFRCRVGLAESRSHISALSEVPYESRIDIVATQAIMSSDGERPALAELVSLLHGDSGELVASRAALRVEVPVSVRDALTRIVDVLALGRAVRIVPVGPELTITEAAELLGVARLTLIKLLQTGEIGYSRSNSSRRIAVDEALAYRDRRDRTRRALLDELTADAVELGMYSQPALFGMDKA